MPSPRKSLSTSVPWQKVLSAVGVRSVSQALPATVSCPVCNGRMLIFPDVTTAGQWHYCFGCEEGNNAGDMLQLASRKWQLSSAATVARLLRTGVRLDWAADREEAVAAYEKHYVRRQNKLQKLWQRSRGNGIRKGEGRSLLRKFGFGTTGQSLVAGEAWDNGPGKLAGFTNANDINRAVFGNLPRFKEKATASAIFKGRRWDNVLFFPYYSLPGKIHAMLIVGREMDRDEDTVFYTVGPVGVKTQEAGLWYHPDVLSSNKPIIMFPDPAVPIRTYIRNYLLQQQIPSMGAWHADLTHRTSREAWYTFRGRKVVFWTDTHDAEVFIQAIRADGYIYSSQVEHACEEGWMKYRTHWKNYHAHDPAFKTMAKKSVHWTAALSDHFATLEDNDVEDFLRKMQDAGEDVERVLRRCYPSQRDRCLSIMAGSRGNRFVLLDGKNVEERETGWYVTNKQGREELVSDAILRIDKVLSQPKSGKALVRGNILYDGKTVPFCVDQEELERNPFKWMRNHLIHQQVGLIAFNPSWKHRVMQLATRFHAPKLAVGLEAVGWNAAEACFDLPSYRIKSFGEIESNEGADVDNHTPAIDLLEPIDLAPTDFGQMLKRKHKNAVFWAAWVAAAANILAPAMGREPQGTLLVGMAAKTGAAAALDALNARDFSLAKHSAEFVMEQAQTHSWPCGASVSGAIKAARIDKILDSDTSGNIMLPVSWYQCMARMIAGGWNCLVNQQSFEFDRDMGRTCRYMLPAYLQYLMKNQLHMAGDKGDFVDNVFFSVRDWVISLHADPHAIDAAQGRLLVGTLPIRAQFAADLFGYIVYDGLLTAKKGIVKPNRKVLWVFPDHYFLPKDAFAEVLHSKGVPQIKPTDVSDCLLRLNALLGETEISGVPGWLVDKKWWDAQVRRVYEQENKLGESTRGVGNYAAFKIVG